jgi:hypothetical protein
VRRQRQAADEVMRAEPTSIQQSPSPSRRGRLAHLSVGPRSPMPICHDPFINSQSMMRRACVVVSSQTTHSARHERGRSTTASLPPPQARTILNSSDKPAAGRSYAGPARVRVLGTHGGEPARAVGNGTAAARASRRRGRRTYGDPAKNHPGIHPPPPRAK